MNLPETLTAVADYFDAALTACGRPVCETYRYLGQTGVLQGPGRCDCSCGEPPGPCRVFDASEAVFEPGENLLIATFGAEDWCSPDGFLSMGPFAPHIGSWSFTLTSDEAVAFNAYGGVWLRAMIITPIEGVSETSDIEADQVTLDVNGTMVNIADLLVAEKIAVTGPTPTWADSNVFIPVTAPFVAGANVITLTLVDRFNAAATLETINVFKVDQIGIGADGEAAGDLTFDEDTGCMVACVDQAAPQGVLRVSWRKVGPTSAPPQFQTVMGQTAPGVPLVELWVRVMRCWPGDAENTTVEQWDAAAAGIAADSDCLASAAHALICKKPGALAELGLAGCNAVGGYSVTPVWPEGGCAGNDLQLFARLSQ